jgi:hypothetical protein
MQHPITILSRNDMHIGGSIDGSAAGSGGPMGLVSLGNIVVPADPDETGTRDWAGQWSIETDRSILVRACVVIPSGSLSAQVPYRPEHRERVSVTGCLVQRSMGRLSSGGSGYELGLTWDQGLGAVHPPHFPMLGRWTVYSWLADPPDADIMEIGEDQI